MVIGLAGRRVDAIHAKHARFSSDRKNIDRVRRRLQAMFVSQGAIALVSSAACGADILALEEAGRLGLRRRIVLPFSSTKFRQTSVIDRPGDWGVLYDKAVDEVRAAGDLVVLKSVSDNDAYITVNHAIIEDAIAMGESLKCPVSAVRVWEGKARGEGDLTEEFGIYAQTRGVRLLDDVMTS